ncbi:MAG: amidohydrolase [Bacteroidetes bacterium]|nr:amidohydrolase [Bacteroidota bacterium]
MSLKNIQVLIDKLVVLRKKLHKNAELSEMEFRTRELISGFIKTNAPDGVIQNIGTTGLAVIFDSKNPGNTIMFRADIDALPITENISFAQYSSVNKGVSHKCGHDGHAAILCGLACLLNESLPLNGKIVLLFQPAEETGKGAKKIIEDEFFKQILPDYIFAMHNLPGFEKNQIVLTSKNFASASKGMIIKIAGKQAHAAYPEYGKNPAIAMSEIIRSLDSLIADSERFDNFVLLTIVYAKLGDKVFGTAPGEAEICATLRSFDNDNMKKLCYEAELIVRETAVLHELNIVIEWTDEFEATSNNPDALRVISEIADKSGLVKKYLNEPFRWSEDFGQFTSRYCGAMFGVGAGIDHPQLHTSEYDFPDDIIETSMNVFYEICKNKTVLSVSKLDV